MTVKLKYNYTAKQDTVILTIMYNHTYAVYVSMLPHYLST